MTSQIAWNDGIEVLRLGTPHDITTKSTNQQPGYDHSTDAYWTGANLDAALAAIQSGRSVEQSRSRWIAEHYVQSRSGLLPHFAFCFFSTEPTNFGVDEGEYSHPGNDPTKPAGYNELDFPPGELAVYPIMPNVICPSGAIIHTPVASHLIRNYGGSLIIEMIIQNWENTIFLDQPPQQAAYPQVAKRWDTFPKVSVKGDYLGAEYRPIAGRLNINIDNLTREWIETKWEPFREHVSKGGMFAYAAEAGMPNTLPYPQDRQGIPSSPAALCYADGRVPAPVIRAGGYGSVALTAGVVPI